MHARRQTFNLTADAYSADAQVVVRRADQLAGVALDPEAIAALGRWMAEGKIKVRTETVDGLENALQTVRKLYTGTNSGKLMIRIAEPSPVKAAV